MGERVIWNWGMPLKEVDGPSSGNTIFSGNRRAGSAGFLVGAILCGGLAWWVFRLRYFPEIALFLALASLGLLCGAMFAIWTQRVIVIDHQRREIALVRMSPWGTRRTAHPFARLRAISVEEVKNSEADRADWLARIVVNVDDGTQVVLGETYPDDALRYARRISGLTGAPLASTPGSSPS